VGNTAAGQSIYYRFPGPFIFGTDSRSATPELGALSSWVASHHVAGGVVTDRFTGEQLTARTSLDVPSPTQGAVYALYSEGAGASPQLRALLRRYGFHYFVVDERLGYLIPAQHPYSSYTGPGGINASAILAMRSGPFSHLVYSSQNYLVFEMNP